MFTLTISKMNKFYVLINIAKFKKRKKFLDKSEFYFIFFVGLKLKKKRNYVFFQLSLMNNKRTNFLIK